MMETDTNVYKRISDAMQARHKYISAKRPEDLWSYALQDQYHKDLLTAKDRGQPVVWINAGTTPELFHAMDIFTVSPEALSSIQAGFPGGIEKYLDNAQNFVPDYICGVNKGMIGSALAGDLPLPDAIVHASHPCDSGLSSFGTLAEYLKIPHFCIDTPYTHNERSYRYLANEMEQMVLFLEEHTGKKLSADKLEEVAIYSNDAQSYLTKINDLRKNVPCPSSTSSLLMNGALCASLSGTPGLVDYLKKQYEIAQAALDEGKGVPSKEKIRLAWIITPILFDLGIFGWMEKKFGAYVAMDLLSNFGADPIDISDRASIFTGIAKRLTKMPMGHMASGHVSIYSNMSVEMCREYKADAAIFAGNVACKHAWATIKLVKDRIKDELDIPTLTFDLDFVDPRVKSSDAIKSQLEDFFTTILN